MIPPIIHHIYLGPIPYRSEFLFNLHSWRDQHPSFYHFLWTERFLPPLTNASTFFASKNDEEKINILSCEVLNRYGGIVVSENSYCREPLKEVLGTCRLLMLEEESELVAIACVQEHPYTQMWERLIQEFSKRTVDAPQSYVSEMRQLLRSHFAGEIKTITNPTCPNRRSIAQLAVERLVIAIKTVNRNPQYIHQTIASLFAADPLVRRTGEVLLLVGCEDWDYLKGYLHHEHLAIVPLYPEEAGRLSRLDRKKSKACLNRLRSFRIPLTGKMGILILEDDVILRDSFLRHLLSTIKEIEERFGITDYALALYSIFDFEQIPGSYLGQRFCKFSAPFSATQAMYYPASVTSGIAEYLEAYGLENYRLPGDLLVGEYMRGRIFCTHRFLAQHIGEISTGLGGTHMDSTVFRRPYTPAMSKHWDGSHPALEKLPLSLRLLPQCHQT